MKLGEWQMSQFVADCPRCGANNMTFDLISQQPTIVKYSWQQWFEVFCICRNCNRSTIFVLSQGSTKSKDEINQGLPNLKRSVNQVMQKEGFINIKDIASVEPPDHIPENIDVVFREGASCISIGCFNAAGTMFRLCIDLVTKTLLPINNAEGLNRTVRRNLGLRLPWLFDNGVLPESLRELSSCVKDYGNDGAHEGTLEKEDAEDLLDFTYELLERIYTEPMRVQLAQERGLARRKSKS